MADHVDTGSTRSKQNHWLISSNCIFLSFWTSNFNDNNRETSVAGEKAEKYVLYSNCSEVISLLLVNFRSPGLMFISTPVCSAEIPSFHSIHARWFKVSNIYVQYISFESL